LKKGEVLETVVTDWRKLRVLVRFVPFVILVALPPSWPS